MISPERYNAIRSQLIVLYQVLTKRTYPVWVYPTQMMTTEQIRNRDVYRSDDTIPDHGYYDTPQQRMLKITDMIKLLENVTDEQPLKINNPKINVIQIYETIQEYGSLWYELYLTNSNFGNINPEEIRYIETLALYLYEDYRQIKSYQINAGYRKQHKTQHEGMSGLMGLLQISSRGNSAAVVEHISYYDLMTTRVIPNMSQGPSVDDSLYAKRFNGGSDTLLRQQEAKDLYGTWE